MIIRVISADPEEDLRVIADLMRLYFPGLGLGKDSDELYLNEEQKGQQQEKQQEIKEVLLQVEKRDAPLEVKVTLHLAGQAYWQTEGLPEETFIEEKKNRVRRLLRLALHKLLERVFRVDLSPWGILTGVRPTKIVQRFIDEGLTKERSILHLIRDYGISPERASLLWQVASFQHPFLPAQQAAEKLVSLYIGIPFCPTRCYYCSFPSFSLKQWGHLLTDYLSGLDRELKTVGKLLTEKQVKVQTVYIGGGTPTILSEAQLARLLETITDSFRFVENRELTVEGGRPDTLTGEKLRVLKDYAVTRLSINPQTMQEETLVAIGRKHSVQETIAAYELAREIGIPIINMDLIIGLPGEDCAVLAKTLTEVLKLGPENITLHALAMKRAAYYRQEKIKLPLPAEGQAMMDLAHNYLRGAGYFPYYLYRQRDIFAHGENVGYSVADKACLYNMQMIAERQTILGLGVGSGSKLVHQADWTLENLYNPKDLVFYLERLEEIIGKKALLISNMT